MGREVRTSGCGMKILLAKIWKALSVQRRHIILANVIFTVIVGIICHVAFPPRLLVG